MVSDQGWLREALATRDLDRVTVNPARLASASTIPAVTSVRHERSLPMTRRSR